MTETHLTAPNRFADVNAQRNYEYYHTGRVITVGARLKF
jgi:hypothetical protein